MTNDKPRWFLCKEILPGFERWIEVIHRGGSFEFLWIDGKSRFGPDDLIWRYNFDTSAKPVEKEPENVHVTRGEFESLRRLANETDERLTTLVNVLKSFEF